MEKPIKSKSDLTTGAIGAHIRRITIPASVGMLFNTLFNVVDTIYAGRIGTNALAGMSLSFPIFFIILSLAFGIGTGSTALISNALGEKKRKKIFTELHIMPSPWVLLSPSCSHSQDAL